MIKFFLVGLGGFFGAVSRFGIYQVMRSYFFHPFPFATLLVNVTGCFAIGILFAYFKNHPAFPTVTLFAVVGFLGAFTTFSAFGFETVELIRNHQMSLALLNVFCNLVLCLAAVIFGGWAGHFFK